MMTLLSAFPPEGTAEFQELCRRQSAVGLPDNLPTCERERLWRDEGIGKFYVRDRKPSTPRPRRSRATRPVAPSIVVRPVAELPQPRPGRLLESTPPPLRKRWWQFWR
jgi:hypothetical protein